MSASVVQYSTASRIQGHHMTLMDLFSLREFVVDGYKKFATKQARVVDRETATNRKGPR